MTEKIKVIGIGDDGKQSLLPIYEKWIYESDVIVGGERQLSFFQDFHGEKMMIKGGLSSLVTKLETEKRNVVVLASGDPLFYGIGSYLGKKLNVEVYPYLSSLQQAFAKINESWQDAYIVSVHGRSMKGLAQRINGREKVALLTDATNSPSQIAGYLRSFGMKEYKAFVAENLGGRNERYAFYELEEMENVEFSPLNVVILKKTSVGKTWSFGIDDEEFHQRKPEKGLLTKKEIRTLSLSEMKLSSKSIVWDIGTCTGSVAIEACLIAKEGQVYAIEKNDHDLENCRLNMQKFRTDFTVVQGKAPDKLEEFPDPDAIFIGGTAGGMEEILSICCARLKQGGRIVLNAVTIENLSQAVEGFKRNGFEVNITLSQISRSKPILNLTRFDALNPIYIITAKHKEGEK
ncbi:precorrin-6y C5,15-methyltransferase (decarboxylating) subunit CbiE [Metabacillus sediminilitoris]|uniref:Precorrin-6y C5,15-methyltransferase (Decarboxylating) subunit CbiE n=1 Tax=Metabacillus sediminilitoris TaxID=2567941 RepID=A0A4S4BU99_9BACI|nr:precorrin-6y C5,15-methyltransferase (decarboxylating) subunit CbiE [Metabacillus sediminilitoris]QGQ45042.1 precorrin-6y C5,15-methyltransferase (decarboxylating) subunit CbiE [Metabacillus sediminilitoris]THF78674.1 precorrin-6y C5,15-methyltransferase (decarboxylating) subunit CbiE [Metabacillus sediminilitoris]